MTKAVIATLFLLILFYFIFSFEIKHYIMMKLEKIDKSLINFELKNEWFNVLSDYEARVESNNGRKFKQQVIPSKTQKSTNVPSWSLLGKL